MEGIVKPLYQVDDEGHLFIAPAIRAWEPLAAAGIDAVIDLEGGLDEHIPTAPESGIYIYFPIFDEGLPNLTRLEGVAQLGAHLVRSGHRLVSHCGMGFNRSALVAARIMHLLGGMSGVEIVDRLRTRRPGALFNAVFADHVLQLPPIVTSK